MNNFNKALSWLAMIIAGNVAVQYAQYNIISHVGNELSVYLLLTALWSCAGMLLMYGIGNIFTSVGELDLSIRISVGFLFGPVNQIVFGFPNMFVDVILTFISVAVLTLLCMVIAKTWKHVGILVIPLHVLLVILNVVFI